MQCVTSVSGLRQCSNGVLLLLMLPQLQLLSLPVQLRLTQGLDCLVHHVLGGGHAGPSEKNQTKRGGKQKGKTCENSWRQGRSDSRLILVRNFSLIHIACKHKHIHNTIVRLATLPTYLRHNTI